MTDTNTHPQILKHDQTLAKVLGQVTAPEIATTNNVFHDLMSCIIEQQIHYRSSKKTFEKLLSFTSLTELTPDNFHEFEKLGLPRTKLSQNKYETIAGVLGFWAENEIHWSSLSDAEVRNKLSNIKGIGPWTMDMILLYTLQRKDIFPAGDYHLKQIMVSLYGLNPKSRLKNQMLEIAETWRPHRSLAVKYLLESKKARLN